MNPGRPNLLPLRRGDETSFLSTWTPQSLDGKATSLPAATYTSPEIYRLEQEHVFGRSWFNVGHTSQLGGPGSYFTTEIAGQPLVIARNEQGELRGYFNICPHRGGPVASSSGECKRFTCLYHAWSFDLDGVLRGAPDMRDAQGFDRSSHGLTAVDVEAWGPFLFARIGKTSVALREQLGELADMFGRYRLDDWSRVHSIDYFVEANWKLYQENVSESYHEPILHASTWTKNYEYARTLPLARGHHYLHHSPLPAGEDILSGKRPGLVAEGLDADERQRMTVIFLFPNFGWALTPTYQVTVMLDPQGPSRTRIRMDWLMPETGTPRTATDVEPLVSFFDVVQKEDLDLLPGIQMRMGSLGHRCGRLSPSREMGVHRMQELLLEYLTGRR